MPSRSDGANKADPSKPEPAKPGTGKAGAAKPAPAKAAPRDAAREAVREAAKAGAKEAPAGGSKEAPKEPAREPAKPRKLPKGGPSKADLKKYRQQLDELRNGQVRDTRGLAREALKSSGQDFSVDHMADHGSDNFEQDFTLGLLEGKSEVLRDVEDAIDKIDGKGELPFGVCEECADLDEAKWARQQARGCETCPWIPKGRLDVVPYARLCIRRQEEQEDRR